MNRKIRCREHHDVLYDPDEEKCLQCEVDRKDGEINRLKDEVNKLGSPYVLFCFGASPWAKLFYAFLKAAGYNRNRPCGNTGNLEIISIGNSDTAYGDSYKFVLPRKLAEGLLAIIPDLDEVIEHTASILSGKVSNIAEKEIGRFMDNKIAPMAKKELMAMVKKIGVKEAKAAGKQKGEDSV